MATRLATTTAASTTNNQVIPAPTTSTPTFATSATAPLVSPPMYASRQRCRPTSTELGIDCKMAPEQAMPANTHA